MALILFTVGPILVLTACTSNTRDIQEILIGIEPGSIDLLLEGGELEPDDTGIPSLDALNVRWGVMDVTPLFSDISQDDEAADRHGLRGILKLAVPQNTDIDAMLEEYQADPHVSYAEVNKPVEIKEPS